MACLQASASEAFLSVVCSPDSCPAALQPQHHFQLGRTNASNAILRQSEREEALMIWKVQELSMSCKGRSTFQTLLGGVRWGGSFELL